MRETKFVVGKKKRKEGPGGTNSRNNSIGNTCMQARYNIKCSFSLISALGIERNFDLIFLDFIK